VTVQPTPNMGAQPTPKSAHPLAQPTPAQYDKAAHWAYGVALLLWLAAVLADRVGCTAQGYAGVVLGGAAMGASITYAHAHDWAVRKVGVQ
jgi:hypothetical protein